MRPVSQCDPSTTILGFKTSIPVFISGAALAKLGHPQGEHFQDMYCTQGLTCSTGEANITRGATATSLIQMVSSNASLSAEEIMAASAPSQTLFFQLYKHANDAIAEKRVRDVERLGYKAIWLTVDAIVPGNREKDVRSPWVVEDMEMGQTKVFEESGAEEETNIFGTAGALIANDDRDMTWEKVNHA